jgi:dTDP-glucose pyrophosphorylase
MIEVGGRPFIEYILEAFRAAEVRDVLIVTGYLAECVEAGLGDGRRLGLRLSSVRQAEPRGNGAAALLAREFVGQGPFLLSWCDILCRPENYVGVRAKFEAAGADGVRSPAVRRSGEAEGVCSPAVRRSGGTVRERLETTGTDGVLALNWVEDPTAGAAVYRNGDRLTGIIEKPPPGTSQSHWNQAGIFAFRPILFDYLARAPASPRGEVELATAEQALLADGRDLRGYEITGRRWNLGTPAELAELRAAAARGGWPEGRDT